MSLSPGERSLRGRVGAYRLHALGLTNTVAARQAFMERFYREVDPQGLLSTDERERRATAARKAHMALLAYRSARARSRRSKQLLEAV